MLPETSSGRPTGRVVTALLLAGLLASACASGDRPLDRGSTAPPATGSALDLRGACPATIGFQSDWFPEMEYAAYYGLLGGKFRVDRAGKRVVGFLVAAGRETGVDLKFCVGGL